MADFPTFDLSPNLTGQPIDGAAAIADASSRGLSMLAGAADAFAGRMKKMANAAAVREGGDQFAADQKAGVAIAPKNENTPFGAGYNDAARLAKGADYKAALLQGLTKAQLENPDDPAAYLKAANATRAGLGSTGFSDLDRELNGFATLQIASGQAQVMQGQQRRTLEQAHQGFLTTLDTEEAAIGHVVTSASFDASGSNLVAQQLQHSFGALAKYGPKSAFDAGGQHFDADPTRAGVLGADDLEKSWQDMSAQARSDWATGAAEQLPDAAAKRRFATDAVERYAKNDPLFAGMDRQQFDRLHVRLDTIANQAETQEDGAKRQAAQDAGNMIEAMRWGGDVDIDQLKARAAASGDPGLMQQAQVFASIGPQVPDILKQVAARSANGADPSTAWATPAPTGGVFDQVRLEALHQGVDVTGQEQLARIAQIESQGDPNAKARTSSASGVFQFLQGPNSKWAQMGGGDPFDAKLNISRGVQSIVADRKALSQKIGREASWGEAYLAHQQGLGGALAFLSHPGETAIQALIDSGVKPDQARASILNNGGSETIKAADFARQWIDKVDVGDSAQSVAWANTRAGFASDPLAYARGAKNRAALAAVAPLPADGFAADASGQAAWAQALRQNYATGLSLSKTYTVPQRMLTDGQKSYYAGKIAADPAYGVALAQKATQAIGATGATQLMQEIGQDGTAPSAYVHLGWLAANGASGIVAKAIDGERLRAQGAKVPEPKAEGPDGKSVDPFTTMQTENAAAFAYNPVLAATAWQVAKDARASDVLRGQGRNPDFYVQGALGATQRNGVLYGGLADVNGRRTVLPVWLRNDGAGAALKALGGQWQGSGAGPVWSDGSAMPAKDVAKMQMVMLQDGRYGLINPKTNAVVRDKSGGVFAFDLDQARALVGGG